MQHSQALTQELRQTARLSQQQLRYTRMLEMNAPEFEEAVEQELESNPALERAESNADTSSGQHPAWQDWQPPRNKGAIPTSPSEIPLPDDLPSLYDHLNIQLDQLDLKPEILQAAKYIVGNLDANGYLGQPLSRILDDLAFSGGPDLPLSKGEEALEAVLSLDPPGVGASTLQQCLAVQLHRMPPSTARDTALTVVEDHFDALALKHLDKIASAMQVPLDQVKQAQELILQLNPKPGGQFESRSDAALNYLVPDFILDDSDAGLKISLNSRIPELAVERSFEAALADMKRNASSRGKESYEFVANRYNDARDFIKLVSNRQQTLLNVATAIIDHQKEYFLSRDVYRLRPMMIKDLQAATGLDASVISRATASKFIQTPWGVFPMRFFFSETVGTSEGEAGEEALTNRKLEAEIQALIETEDKHHPLSDGRLGDILKQKGYDVARRTIAKYRDRIGIPVARLRKEI